MMILFPIFMKQDVVGSVRLTMFGGCLCGYITYQTENEHPLFPHLCSCHICQKWSGVPTVAWAEFSISSFFGQVKAVSRLSTAHRKKRSGAFVRNVIVIYVHLMMIMIAFLLQLFL